MSENNASILKKLYFLFLIALNKLIDFKFFNWQHLEPNQSMFGKYKLNL